MEVVEVEVLAAPSAVASISIPGDGDKARQGKTRKATTSAAKDQIPFSRKEKSDFLAFLRYNKTSTQLNSTQQDVASDNVVPSSKHAGSVRAARHSSILFFV
jgi:hypothetical protein